MEQAKQVQNLEQEIRNKALENTPWGKIILPHLVKLHRFLKSEEWDILCQFAASLREEAIWDILYKKLSDVELHEAKGKVVGLDMMLLLKDQISRLVLKNEKEQSNG